MSERILIVEDNPVNIDIFEEIFEDNYEIRVATDGQHALEVLEDFIPEIVLLDVMMPNLDGYAVCRSIRANPVLSGVKVIMVSARAMDSEQKKGMDSGADLYITKPFDEDDLLDKVKSFIQ